IVTAAQHKGRDMTEMVGELRDAAGREIRHIVIDPTDPSNVTVDGAPAPIPGAGDRRRTLSGRELSVADIFLINSTSGTTGMPKCVVHNQNRWLYYHTQVLRTAELSEDDVWMSVIPAPYGFGIW